MILYSSEFQVLRERFGSLGFASEVPECSGEDCRSRFGCLSILVIVKVSLDETWKKKFQSPQHGAWFMLIWNQAGDGHNLGSESNYFQQPGSHPGHSSFETLAFWPSPAGGSESEGARALKFRLEVHKQSTEQNLMEPISYLASAQLYGKFMGIYCLKNRRTFTYRCRGINFKYI